MSNTQVILSKFYSISKLIKTHKKKKKKFFVNLKWYQTSVIYNYRPPAKKKKGKLKSFIYKL